MLTKNKNLLLTYKALHNLAPTYLCDLLHEHSPSRTLRSSASGLLTIPTSRLSTMGAQALSCSAQRLWNSLPPHIRQLDSITSFKSQLKTHLNWHTLYNWTLCTSLVFILMFCFNVVSIFHAFILYLFIVR